MIIRYVSDLHLEGCPFYIPPESTDKDSILVLAGDVCTAFNLGTTVKNFFDAASHRFKHIVWVPGNHEYYRGHLQNSDIKLREFAKSYGNISFLNGDTVILDDIVFVGATLWTDGNKGDYESMVRVERALNDYNLIRSGKDNHILKIEETMELHNIHKKYIFDEVKKYKDDGWKVVVVSHHCPSELSSHPKWKNSFINGGFYSELRDEIKQYQPDVWIHGHTHDSFNYRIGTTKVVCNPRGYTRIMDSYLFTKIEHSLQHNTNVKLNWMEYENIFSPENVDFNPYLDFDI